jgi:methylenetetrahydrofolate dehydrogenase (NADP+)/methenyltetrahydrofolate cyclohydrolase
METRILRGKPVAEAIKAEVTSAADQLRKRGIVPGLAAVLVGDDPASQLYVNNKTRTCEELGMHSELVRLPAETVTPSTAFSFNCPCPTRSTNSAF